MGLRLRYPLSDPITIDRATKGLRLFYPSTINQKTTLGLRLDVSVSRLASSKAFEQLVNSESHCTIVVACLIPLLLIDRAALGFRTDNSGYTHFYCCLQHCSWIEIILPETMAKHVRAIFFCSHYYLRNCYGIEIILPMANPGSLSLTIETRSFGS